MSWPPSYTLRKSKRAKHLHLKISARGIEIVLPWRCPQREALHFLNAKRDWIESKLKHFPLQTPTLEAPTTLHLAAINQSWQIDYQADSGPARLRKQAESTLLIAGDYTTKERWKALLQNWLKKQALAVLPAWLTRVSQEVNLPFANVAIRAQKTRWGSCSSQKNINLNYKLLFLKPELVRHILLHELCHTVHLNHSKKFWELLNQLDPNTKHLEPKSPHHLTAVPVWLENLD